MTEIDRVLIVGAGLMGTSVGLALQRRGVRVWITDATDRNVALAESIGAGERTGNPSTEVDPQVVVVGVPPAVAGEVVAKALGRFPTAVVTDIASVKGPVVAAVVGLADLDQRRRYVPGHPMAGWNGRAACRSERPVRGCAWAVVTDADRPLTPSAPCGVGADLRRCDGRLGRPRPRRGRGVDLASAPRRGYDRRGAAGRRTGPYLELAGQGVRDVTRIAAVILNCGRRSCRRTPRVALVSRATPQPRSSRWPTP